METCKRSRNYEVNAQVYLDSNGNGLITKRSYCEGVQFLDENLVHVFSFSRNMTSLSDKNHAVPVS